MTLISAIDAYLTLKRSLGAGLKSQETILRVFSRTVGDIPLDAISAEACSTFCRSMGPPTRHWENKHQTLRGFFNYLVSRGYLATSPLQEPGPRALRSFQPYIYSHEELQRLLDATATLTSKRFPLQPLTYRTLILELVPGVLAGKNRPEPRFHTHSVPLTTAKSCGTHFSSLRSRTAG
ncbi:MAG: hypothetical protein OEU26_05250 [Candidatus Tectomicrobia bacterium]|nr:hypothetical protein [Candidatus Tectomicrobia bacterium]